MQGICSFEGPPVTPTTETTTEGPSYDCHEDYDNRLSRQLSSIDADWGYSYPQTGWAGWRHQAGRSISEHGAVHAIAVNPALESFVFALSLSVHVLRDISPPRIRVPIVLRCGLLPCSERAVPLRPWLWRLADDVVSPQEGARLVSTACRDLLLSKLHSLS